MMTLFLFSSQGERSRGGNSDFRGDGQGQWSTTNAVFFWLEICSVFFCHSNKLNHEKKNHKRHPLVSHLAIMSAFLLTYKKRDERKHINWEYFPRKWLYDSFSLALFLLFFSIKCQVRCFVYRREDEHLFCSIQLERFRWDVLIQFAVWLIHVK